MSRSWHAHAGPSNYLGRQPTRHNANIYTTCLDLRFAFFCLQCICAIPSRSSDWSTSRRLVSRSHSWRPADNELTHLSDVGRRWWPRVSLLTKLRETLSPLGMLPQRRRTTPPAHQRQWQVARVTKLSEIRTIWTKCGTCFPKFLSGRSGLCRRDAAGQRLRLSDTGSRCQLWQATSLSPEKRGAQAEVSNNSNPTPLALGTLEVPTFSLHNCITCIKFEDNCFSWHAAESKHIQVCQGVQQFSWMSMHATCQELWAAGRVCWAASLGRA